jgi:predicted Zn-dependent protease
MRAALPLALAMIFGTALWAADTAPPEVVEELPTYAQAQSAIDAADFPTAQRILAQLTVTEPENADVWNLFGYTSRNMNLAGPALEAYDMALKLDPEHLGALEYQGVLFVELKRMDEAAANLVKLKDLCGECEEALDLEAAIAAAPVEEVAG